MSAHLLQLRFPLREGDLAGCEASLSLEGVDEHARADFEVMVAGAEPCEGRCGAAVAVSDLSGHRLGLLAYAHEGALAKLNLPRGLWEAAHDDVDDEGRAVRAVVFHSPDRCRELRAKAAGVRIAIDADCPGCGYPERAFDPSTARFSCSSLNPAQCDYTSAERDS